MGQTPIDNINNKNKDKDPMPITCLLNSLIEKLQRKTKYRDQTMISRQPNKEIDIQNQRN